MRYSSCDAFKAARRLSRLRGCRSQATNFPLLIETETRNRANFVVHCGSGVQGAIIRMIIMQMYPATRQATRYRCTFAVNGSLKCLQ